jgi:hypothetical protein
MFSRAPLLLTALALAAGCRLNGPAVGRTADIRRTQEPVLAAEVTLEVVAKRAPDLLMAPDGSSCRVATDVYANTSVGSLFRCRWSRG